MTYKEYRRGLAAKKDDGTVKSRILSKKPLTAVDFLDLATETAKYTENQEKARKKAKENLDIAYDRHLKAVEALLKPASTVPDPNRAFRRLKRHGRTQIDVEAAIEGEEKEEPSRDWIKSLTNEIISEEEDDWIDGAMDEDYWDEDETN